MAHQSLTTPEAAVVVNKLPAYCPNPDMPLWSSHPKVVMAFDAHGDAKCPYCGTRYHTTSASHH